MSFWGGYNIMAEEIKDKLWSITAVDWVRLIGIAVMIVWGYSRLSSEVEQLKALRAQDKQDYKEIMIEMKTEIRELRQELMKYMKDVPKN